MLCLIQSKKVMTIPEFLEYERLKDRRQQELEVIAAKIKKNKKMERTFVVVLAICLLYLQSTVHISIQVANTKGIDPLGFKLLGIFRQFAYWICIIMCIVEICKNLLQGDTKSLGKIIVKYLLAFASCYFVPYLFDLIKESF